MVKFTHEKSVVNWLSLLAFLFATWCVGSVKRLTYVSIGHLDWLYYAPTQHPANTSYHDDMVDCVNEFCRSSGAHDDDFIKHSKRYCELYCGRVHYIVNIWMDAHAYQCIYSQWMNITIEIIQAYATTADRTWRMTSSGLGIWISLSKSYPDQSTSRNAVYESLQ